ILQYEVPAEGGRAGKRVVNQALGPVPLNKLRFEVNLGRKFLFEGQAPVEKARGVQAVLIRRETHGDRTRRRGCARRWHRAVSHYDWISVAVPKIIGPLSLEWP